MATGTTAQNLITEHMGMAKRIARAFARRLPPSVCVDDLESIALVGLSEAALRYDTSRDEPFGAFAAKRMRGAILDELRRLDPHSRRERREIEEAAARGEATEQRMLVAYDDAWCAANDNERESRAHEIDHGRLVRALESALEALPTRERDVVDMYYGQAMSLQEIGAAYGVTESRACQLRGRAVKKLRGMLRDGGPAPAPANDNQPYVRRSRETMVP